VGYDYIPIIGIAFSMGGIREVLKDTVERLLHPCGVRGMTLYQVHSKLVQTCNEDGLYQKIGKVDVNGFLRSIEKEGIVERWKEPSEDMALPDIWIRLKSP